MRLTKIVDSTALKKSFFALSELFSYQVWLHFHFLVPSESRIRLAMDLRCYSMAGWLICSQGRFIADSSSAISCVHLSCSSFAVLSRSASSNYGDSSQGTETLFCRCFQSNLRELDLSASCRNVTLSAFCLIRHR